MNVVVLYNEPDENASTEDTDVLVQRDVVVAALLQLGHNATSLGCGLNLERLNADLMRLQPDLVFNLVESLGGSDQLMTLATMLLDHLWIPYSGSQTDSLAVASNKLNAKSRLIAAGQPTPKWFASGEGIEFDFDLDSMSQWILKPVLEHASFGMDDSAIVVANSARQLSEKLAERQRQIGKPLFAEQFIEGREFNLSMLAGRVLPAAEIDFSTFPPDKPRIVGQLAKWDVDSFEYQQTPRTFDFASNDHGLLNRLTEIATECWQLFGINGYARIDFRVDRQGEPWILEINANPCLSPDAGFAAALSQAEIEFHEAIQIILDNVAVTATEDFSRTI